MKTRNEAKKKWLERKYWRVQTEALKIKIAAVHKISSEDYERDSLRVLVTAIKRYLTEKVSKRSMCHKFRSSKQLPGETPRTSRQQREGKRPSSCLVSKALFALKDHYPFKMF